MHPLTALLAAVAMAVAPQAKPLPPGSFKVAGPIPHRAVILGRGTSTPDPISAACTAGKLDFSCASNSALLSAL